MRVLDDGTLIYGTIPDWLFLRCVRALGLGLGWEIRVVGRAERAMHESRFVKRRHRLRGESRLASLSLSLLRARRNIEGSDD